MRKVTAFIIGILLLLALPMTAFATSQQDMVVTVTVPDEHTVTLNGSNVALSYGGTVGTVVAVTRHSTPAILLLPDAGYEVAQVLYGGADITASFKNGLVTLPSVWRDDVLRVVTRKAGPVDTYGLSGTVLDAGGNPVTGALVQLNNPGSASGTDSAGRYTFQDVPLGANTITVTLPDGTTGTVSISVVEGDTLAIGYANGIYTIVLPKGAEGLKLKLGFDAQGRLVIHTGNAVWPFFDTDNPRTGDIIFLAVGVLLLSGMSLLGIWLYLHKRRKNET